MKMISVAKDFSRYPAGRFLTDGPYSGERFREEFLIEPISRNEPIEVDLDGVAGYGSSFLEEAFGGLVRKFELAKSRVDVLIRVKTNDDSILEEVKEYMYGSAK